MTLWFSNGCATRFDLAGATEPCRRAPTARRRPSRLPSTTDPLLAERAQRRGRGRSDGQPKGSRRSSLATGETTVRCRERGSPAARCAEGGVIDHPRVARQWTESGPQYRDWFQATAGDDLFVWARGNRVEDVHLGARLEGTHASRGPEEDLCRARRLRGRSRFVEPGEQPKTNAAVHVGHAPLFAGVWIDAENGQQAAIH